MMLFYFVCRKTGKDYWATLLLPQPNGTDNLSLRPRPLLAARTPLVSDFALRQPYSRNIFRSDLRDQAQRHFIPTVEAHFAW
jgi:hypothetical protein